MFDSPSSLEIISVAQILLNLGDEAMTGSLRISNRSPLWIEDGNLIMTPAWDSIRKLVPLLVLDSGSVQFIECEELDEKLLEYPVKALDWCVLEALRLFDREWEYQYSAKLPDPDTKLKTTNEFRGTIEFNRLEKLIHQALERKEASCQDLAKELDLSLKQVRLVVCRLSIIGLIEEIHQLDTIAKIGRVRKPDSWRVPLPEPVKNQLGVGLPIAGLVFLWLFNILGGGELKLLSLMQRIFVIEESLNNIVLIELSESERDNLAQIARTIEEGEPSIVGLISHQSPTELSAIDYFGHLGDTNQKSDDERVLAAPRLVDSDGEERRGLIAQKLAGDFRYTFGAKLALERLKKLGVTPQWHETKFQFSLSRTNIPPLIYGNSLYPRQNLPGYQILLNPIFPLEVLSWEDILESDFELNELADKIVMIGFQADLTTEISDLQYQAGIANQLLLSGIYGRQPIAVASRWYSIILALLLWGTVCQIALKLRQSSNKQFKFTILILILVGTYLTSILTTFTSGTWLALSYPFLASILGIVSAWGYRPARSNSYIDAESNLLSNKGFFDTMRKLLDLQFDNLENSTLYIICVENYQYLTKNVKNLLGLIIDSITQVIDESKIEDYTIGRLNLNRFGLLIPNLGYESSKLLKVEFYQVFSKLTGQFKGVSPRITIGMATFDSENYVSPIELIASADSDSIINE
ncbi:MAG: hypothetical protein QNJ72_44440 [Pleurocapsa sp. MO_226.B13]|nr:hypothetical protein [Pleurocapsa sp. MO_226.B13]